MNKTDKPKKKGLSIVQRMTISFGLGVVAYAASSFWVSKRLFPNQRETSLINSLINNEISLTIGGAAMVTSGVILNQCFSSDEIKNKHSTSVGVPKNNEQTPILHTPIDSTAWLSKIQHETQLKTELQDLRF